MWRLLSAKLERSGVPPGRAELPDSAQDRSSTSQGGVSEVLPRASLPASSSPPPVSQPPYDTDPSESEARGGGGLWKSRFQIHLRQWVRTAPGTLAECAGATLTPPPGVPQKSLVCEEEIERHSHLLHAPHAPRTPQSSKSTHSGALSVGRVTLQFYILLIQVQSQTATIPIF